jgi:membrane-bound ClpP family serine protease
LEFLVLPGYAIFGLGGGILVLISLILASQTSREFPQNAYQLGELQRSLLTIAGAAAGFIVIAVLLQKWLPSAPILSQMYLAPPSGEEAQTISRREAMVDLGDLHGARGTAATQLTPSGKARFADRLVDVITDGDVIHRGAEIEVVEIVGNRIVVREVKE